MPFWIPLREADKLTWLQNFALKLNVYVGTAGIVAGDVTAVNGAERGARKSPVGAACL